MKKKYSPNADWIRLLECDSPVLSTVAVDETFPQGPLIPRQGILSDVQKVYEEFRAVLLPKNKTTSTKNKEEQERYRRVWVNWVQQNILNWREDDKRKMSFFWLDDVFLSEAESYVLTHRDEPRLFFAFFPKEDDFRQNCCKSKTALDEAVEIQCNSILKMARKVVEIKQGAMNIDYESRNRLQKNIGAIGEVADCIITSNRVLLRKLK